MAAGVMLLMLSAIPGLILAEDFYGDSTSFVNPHKGPDGNIKVAFHHRRNGRKNCVHQLSYICEGCSSLVNDGVMQTDHDNKGRWCQSEEHTTANISLNASHISLSNAGCCWAANMDAKTDWTSHAYLDLGTRSDTEALNNCPVTATVSSLRVPQNCFSKIHLLAHDPDGDQVKCHLSIGAGVHHNISLDETTCTLEKTGYISDGVYVFEVMLKDFPTQKISLSYANGKLTNWENMNENVSPLCQIKLQFLLEILPSLPNCELGHVQPMFLEPTPKHGYVLHATVGDKLILHAKAQAHHAIIHDFQVSGPHDLKKEFRDHEHGTAELTLTWTPRNSDAYRVAPVCFTAETNESQSEMRCVVVMVSKPPSFHGKTAVTCRANQMMITIERSTLSDVDVNQLSLNDPSCLVTYNTTHIMASVLFSNCGTTVEEEEEYIFFQNEIRTSHDPSKTVFRSKTVKIGFSCQFPKTATLSSNYNVEESEYVFSDSKFDSFSYSFDVYSDGNFTNKVPPSAYPVQVEFLQNIYLGIKAESDLANVSLFLDSCKATPDDNADNVQEFYDLIKEGCVTDQSLRAEMVDALLYHLEFQAFKFGDNDQVYITCTVLMCDVTDPFSRCAMGCLDEQFRRRRRATGKQASVQSLTQGPFQFIAEAIPSAAVQHDNGLLKVADVQMIEVDVRKKSEMDDNDALKKNDAPIPGENILNGGQLEMKKMLSTNFSTAIFGSVCSLSVLMLAIVVAYYARKSKGEVQKPLLVS
ncbi:uncharacterized protein LOC130925722 [Corythoichthys intestinalis]|uniref:uncharacterized protein LOC130925722 n=1 Tax=Corythoichthys intestinalis TaxID=161448 RepID=UPI0025A5226B|nr:uncharacterized protein LOC130925722 [Corythoichthys intestinalis]